MGAERVSKMTHWFTNNYSIRAKEQKLADDIRTWEVKKRLRPCNLVGAVSHSTKLLSEHITCVMCWNGVVLTLACGMLRLAGKCGVTLTYHLLYIRRVHQAKQKH